MERVLTLKATPRIANIEGLLEILQDAATTHAKLWHCGRDEMLRDYNCVWMIVRVWVKLHEPLPDRELEIRTWTRPVSRGTSRREFDIYCDGRLVAESVQAWVLADVDTRRMKNMAAIAPMVAAPCCDAGKEIKLRRPAMPQELEVLGHAEVKAADIDINGHLNNAHYPRYALSVFPGRKVSQLLMSYSHECFAGDTIEILGKAEGDQAWLRGTVAGRDSFDLQVDFFPELI